MNALDFLNDSSLTDGDFDQKTHFIVPNLLAQHLITLIYADGGNGKSWMAFALANACAQQQYNVLYLDFDNPLSVLKTRNIDTMLVQPHPSLQYIQRSKSQYTPQELLQQLNQRAVAGAYQRHVIFIDSLRNFCNVTNDQQAMDTMNQLMNLREAGATIVILHHCNKDGRNYQGSNNIRNSIDNMYQLTKLANTPHDITLRLTVKKERASIEDSAFTVCTQTLRLSQKALAEATLSDEAKAFIHDVTTALKDQPLNKTQLLQAVNKQKGDKTARGWLDQYDGEHWQSSRKGNTQTYQLT